MASSSRSAAVKRLMREYADLQNDPSPEFTACPLPDSLLEWHFTIRGPNEGGFSGGRYHGRIVFPAEYPFKPPNIYFLTPNGRFELNKKICLSITGYHPEYWRPAWGVRSSMIALISFMTSSGDGAIAALDYTEEERAHYAKLSRQWECSVCGSKNATALPDEKDAPSLKLEADPELTFSVRQESPTIHSDNESIIQESLVENTKETMPLSVDTENHAPLPSPPHTAEPLKESEIRLRRPPPSTIPVARPSTAFAQQKSRVDSALLAILFLVLVMLARRFIAFYLSSL